ncbi:hypothetical protein ANN_03800 [Periplaneta americana]|uniref:Mariner Mos1 transposase n=1 Tax=Periplaneta americana TaxID=6978 RepID=A0ABQ8U3W2_PERAM|nr:hypothetical protein ANN_03800 [Periplaneta americana]
MDLREVGYDGRNWINLAQDRERWRGYGRAAVNLRRSRFSSKEDKRNTSVEEIDHGKTENEEERRKFEANFQEKAVILESTPENSGPNDWTPQKVVATHKHQVLCFVTQNSCRDFLNKIIAGDETWCYLYDPVPKRQSSEWKLKTSPRKQKFPRDTSKGKVMLEVFFDSQGLIHHEFIPEGRTVIKELYVEILLRLRDSVRRKRPEKWHNITALDHPPYSPDLSPPDYFLFPRLTSHLKGRRFNAEEVIANATRALRRVSQNGFQACFQELYTRWQKCVAEGNYFEGNAVE